MVGELELEKMATRFLASHGLDVGEICREINAEGASLLRAGAGLPSAG